jgi:hypothetical protein
MHVESRQGLYGGVAVSRGLLCTTPARAGVVEGLAPGGIAHARQPAGCTVVPEGLPFGGAPAGGGRVSQLARWPWWVGRRRRRAGAGRIMQWGRLTSRRQSENWPVGKWC